MKHSQLVLSAIGKDQPGIVDRMSHIVFEHKLNITDSRMSVLGGEFAIQMLVEGPWNQLAMLETSVQEIENELGLRIITKRTDIPISPQDLLPYSVEVVALDHPGIVYKLANFFSKRQVNIIDLTTGSYSAPHTGTPMFSIEMRIGIPGDIPIGELREEFMDYCDEHNLDSVMEPVK